MSAPEPYAGAIVLYVDRHMGDIYPAIITQVLSATGGRVRLTAFPPGTAPHPLNEVTDHDPQKQKGTWHWHEPA